MRSFIAGLVAVAFFGTCTVDVRADAAPADPHAAAAPAKHAKDPDPIGFTGYKRWDLAVYTIVVFVLLFLILNKFAFPNIVKGLKAREDLIAAAKEEAILAKKEAEKLRVDLAAEREVEFAKIRALMEEARRDADALKAKEREQGQKEAAAERERSKREIEAATNAALQMIYEKSVDLATMISTKAIKKNMNADDHRRLVEESIADLKTGRI